MIYEENELNSVFYKVLRYLLICSPAIVLLSFIQHSALNLPHWDDYGAVLNFLNDFKKAGYADKLSLLVSQHNEHRILFSRLAYVVYYYIFGDVNFKNIIFINFFQLVSIYAMLVFIMKKAAPLLWPVLSLALSICIFDLDGFENADLAMCGMQNYSVILLFLASILLYSQQNRNLYGFAALAQIICMFSSGNGNVGAFFIVLYTLLSKDKVKFRIALACFIIFAPLYFIHYNKPPSDFSGLTFSRVSHFFLHAVGAHFSYLHGAVAGLILTIIFITGLPIEKKLRGNENLIILMCIGGFLISSMGVMALFRTHLPMIGSYQSRYFIYSHLIVVVTFVLLLSKISSQKIQLHLCTLLVISSLLVYAVDFNYGKNGFETTYQGIKSADYDYPDKTSAKLIADESCKLGIYCIEKEHLKIK